MNMREELEAVLSKSEFARSYSGRAMYGTECLGFSGDSLGELIADMIDTVMDESWDAESERNLLAELSMNMRGLKTDNMGTGIVCYFPTLRWRGNTDE